MARYKAHCCGDILESKHVHDWVVCSCGRTFVDGGDEYTRAGWSNGDQPPERLPD